MNKKINQLIDYALNNHMITQEDVDYSANLLVDLFQLDFFEREQTSAISIYKLLDEMLDYAVEKRFIEHTITDRDLFDTRIMNCIMPRPGEVVNTFYQKYDVDPKQATDYFYHLSIASNYIRKSRIDKNIEFTRYYKYGNIQITINLSKPEKDPKEIAKAKLIKSSGYPKCLLCKENEGFAGNANHPARQTHRIIPLSLNGEAYHFQYSPYVYYNEHCIVFNDQHIPMRINQTTFDHLLDFVNQFPHYMIGSNADLPIVGGSILSHDHYQGGNHLFPIQEASVLKEFTLPGYENIKVEMLYWPLSTLRLTANDSMELSQCANMIYEKWKQYSDESLDILAYSQDTPHNTVTPIARRKEDAYQMDLVLRNNRTSSQYPLGIFHPHNEHHHIKKENIGLIEVMGLAVLPARLKMELEDLKQCLLKKKNIEDYEYLEKHKEWFEYLKTLNFNEETIDQMMEKELTKKFVLVLEDAGVFKMNDGGMEGFTRFVESIYE